MHAFSPRLTRAAIGLAAVSAFAFAPMAAQAADAPLAGTLTGGSLTNSAPALTAFGVGLTGVAQDVYTEVGAWNITDARGSNLGWNVGVTTTDPVVRDSTTHAAITDGAGTSGSITLTAKQPAATAGNSAVTPPAPATAAGVLDPTTAYVIDNAAAGTAQGSWDAPVDTGSMGVGTVAHAANNSLHVVIPADAAAGDYSSTMTFTVASGA